jgi:4-amino-4-deoxy-L-arabinose transferase-like glycosyltransferase
VVDDGGPDPLSPDARRAHRRALGLLAVLAVILTTLGLYEAWDDAPTFDEPISLAAGLTALTRHDLRLNQEHPPLAKALAALPALLAHPRLPAGDAWRMADDTAYAEEVLAANAATGNLRRTMFLARLVPLAAAVATGFALYALGRRLFGTVAGAVAGAAWLTLPPVLGFGHIDGLDVPFTLVAVLAALALDRYLERPEGRRAAVLGLAVGACLLVRTSGLVVAGIVLVVVLVAGRGTPAVALRRAGLVALVAWACLWGGYRALAPGGGIDGPLPREYREGLASQELFGEGGQRSFVLGDYDTRADWEYWPASLAVKVPVTTFALFALGGVALWRRRERPRLRAVAVGAVAAALALGTVVGARPVGMRYLLPSLALGLVLAATGVELAVRHRRRMAMVGAALAAQLGLLVTSAPHSLAWTAIPNEAPWQVGADSNVDWGQDWYRLQSWSFGRHPRVAWTGPMQEDWLPGARPLIGMAPDKVRGWVAVNATTLTVYAHDQLSWLRAYCPVGDLGGSILLYRFDEPPTADPGPETPPGECDGPVSLRVAP